MDNSTPEQFNPQCDVTDRARGGHSILPERDRLGDSEVGQPYCHGLPEKVGHAAD